MDERLLGSYKVAVESWSRRHHHYARHTNWSISQSVYTAFSWMGSAGWFNERVAQLNDDFLSLVPSPFLTHNSAFAVFVARDFANLSSFFGALNYRDQRFLITERDLPWNAIRRRSIDFPCSKVSCGSRLGAVVRHSLELRRHFCFSFHYFHLHFAPNFTDLPLNQPIACVWFTWGSLFGRSIWFSCILCYYMGVKLTTNTFHWTNSLNSPVSPSLEIFGKNQLNSVHFRVDEKSDWMKK